VVQRDGVVAASIGADCHAILPRLPVDIADLRIQITHATASVRVTRQAQPWHGCGLDSSPTVEMGPAVRCSRPFRWSQSP
jgi:hypothetical protein